MAKTNHITNSFVAGEVSPRFFGRTDTQQYNSAAEKLFNSLVYPQGGSGRRPGTKFVMSVLNPMNQPPGQVRLIPFHGSDGTRWQLVITCEPPQSAADSSDPSYGSVDYYDVGNWSWKAINVETEEVYAIKNNFGQFSGANTTFTDYYDYESDGVDLNTLQYAQNNDTLFIVDGVHRPLILIYDPALLNTGATPNLDNGVFSLYEWPRYQFPISNPDYPSQEVATYRQMPFLDAVNDSSTDQINLAASGGGVLTISSSGLFDEETWIGRVIRFTRGADACVVVVTAVTDVNNASVSLIAGTAPANGTNKNYGGNTTDYYEEGAWNDEYGWPRTVCFFEQRLVFGGTATFPDTIWFSRVGNIDIIDNIGLVDDSDFLDAIANTDEFKTTLKGNLLNEIRWMFDSKNITAGTNYREYVVQGPSTAKTIGPDNVQTQGETPHGSAQVQAVRIENTTVFVQRHRRAVRELVYNLDENSFKAPNLSIISAHMPVKAAEEKLGDWRHKARGYFVAMAMQEVPLGILWCLDNNGRLSGMTRERQQEVNAWHQHELGGASFIKTVEGDVSMKPFIHSISAIQRPQSTTYEDGPTGEPDELWVAVARGYKEPGSTDYEEGPVMYIEKFMDEWEDPTIEDGWITDANPKRAPVYMDCCRYYRQRPSHNPWGDRRFASRGR
jgi:hypothetical protein